MKLDLGQTIDRFVVERVLGAGGTAMVYLVRHNSLGTLHALKVLTLTGSSIRERMEREGQVQANLNHPNVVAVTDQLDVDGALGLLMEYIDGPSLEAALQRYRLTMGDAETLFSGILSGVHAAHSAGLVHRDLKPANVLLSRSADGFIPKVTDFGLVKVLEQDDSVAHTRSGIAMGTPSYMAPEQIRDARTVDQRADIWSLGCILYELTTRIRAFPGDEALAIYNAVVDGDYLPPRTHEPEMPERLHQAIMGCLQVELNNRIPDCDTLSAVMAGTLPWLIESEPGTSPIGEPVTEDFVRKRPSLPPERATFQPKSDAPTMKMAPLPRLGERAATPAPAAARSSSSRSNISGLSSQAGLAPVEIDPAAVPRLGLGGLPASFGAYEGDEAETVITNHRTVDGTLSPLDSFDRPARAGLLGFLGGSLLAFGVLGLAVGGVLVLVALLVGSMMLSQPEPTDSAPVHAPDRPSPTPIEPVPEPAPTVPVRPAPVLPAPVLPVPAPAAPVPAPAQPAPVVPVPVMPVPAMPAPAMPAPAAPVPTALPLPDDPVQPVPAPTAPVPAASGKQWAVIRTDPLVAEIQVAGGPRVRTPHKFEIAPGTYIVRGWSGEKSAEFVITVNSEAGAINEFCYSFRSEDVLLGTCPPH